MLDILLKNGKLVDGTGTPARNTDIGIRGNKIVSVGKSDEPAARTIDASGQVVAPGFVDIHTHYDAQVMWDPVASPSSMHGVTTVIGGNCGFTIAPMKQEHIEYLSSMLAVVEGMPLESLKAGIHWNWETFGEWLGVLDQRAGVNMGFLVGHSTIRRLTMGKDSVGHAATKKQVEAQARLLHQCLAEGALGFSSSWSPGHVDADNEPVPSRHARQDELFALAAAVREHPGTVLEFAPGIPGVFGDHELNTMIGMSKRANRSLNWNSFRIQSDDAPFVHDQLNYSRRAEAAGARVCALTYPETTYQLVTLTNPLLWSSLPGWAEVMKVPLDERIRQMKDPAVRAGLREKGRTAATSRSPFLKSLALWESLTFAHCALPKNQDLVGKTVGEVARARSQDALDTLLDVATEEGLRTYFQQQFPEEDAEVLWKRRANVWKDRGVIIGSSDAGAHVDMACGPRYTTALIGRSVRDRHIISLEDAVRLITDVPARFYGLRGRGRIAEGWLADVVVFDPAKVDYQPVHLRADFPAGAQRLYTESSGMSHVFVNGREVAHAGGYTGNLPGTVLRSGRDTETVAIA